MFINGQFGGGALGGGQNSQFMSEAGGLKPMGAQVMPSAIEMPQAVAPDLSQYDLAPSDGTGGLGIVDSLFSSILEALVPGEKKEEEAPAAAPEATAWRDATGDQFARPSYASPYRGVSQIGINSSNRPNLIPLAGLAAIASRPRQSYDL